MREFREPYVRASFPPLRKYNVHSAPSQSRYSNIARKSPRNGSCKTVAHRHFLFFAWLRDRDVINGRSPSRSSGPRRRGYWTSFARGEKERRDLGEDERENDGAFPRSRDFFHARRMIRRVQPRSSKTRSCGRKCVLCWSNSVQLEF